MDDSKVKLYKRIGELMLQADHCLRSENVKKYNSHSVYFEEIERICKTYMPAGSGFDTGTMFNFDESNVNRLVFDVGYHHMDEHGYYDGWSHLKIKVYPSFAYGFNFTITGARRKDKGINKEYFDDTFQNALDQEIEFVGIIP